MVYVQLSLGSGVQHIFSASAPLTVRELRSQVTSLTRLSEDDFYVVHNGRLAYDDDICGDSFATIVPRLLGGKGGFGSMLRAIGAQIEKTTNREACRDLSGRRLRDINEEKRLKAWIEKQGKREEEAAERKKRKLERLCAVPKHEFKDQGYERERSVLTERVGDAVEQGFKAAVPGTSGTKRKHEEAVKPSKRKTLLDFDIDSDELGSSDDSDYEGSTSDKPKEKGSPVLNDSGHSSDESGRIDKSISNVDSEYSETSSDIKANDDARSSSGNSKDNKIEIETTESSTTTSVETKEDSVKMVQEEEEEEAETNIEKSTA